MVSWGKETIKKKIGEDVAEFPGKAPYDPETEIGKFRVYVGDTVSEPADPPVQGEGLYKELSDAEIEVFLSGANGNIYRALGDYNMALAAKAAEESQIVQDFDLKISLVQRSNDYRRTGLGWWTRADKHDETTGTPDVFEMFVMGNVEPVPAELDTIPWPGGFL